MARRLFSFLKIDGDLRCEDAFETSFHKESFDVVYSLGVIEHFDDPTPLIRCHLELLAPGGIAVIAIPNFSGVYGRLQRYFDPENLTIHNLSIMSPEALRRVVPIDGPLNVRTFREGRLSPWAVSWTRRWPRPVALAWQLGWNALGLLQPMTVPVLAPWLVLTVERRPHD